ncbi:MAG: 2-C-methyl-D-erythritol 4-phosphate cytidylyltransferase [Bacteroidales bacterium]|nr:2-C-methyl-D-erythritol 4-phosphate cytidylyltransferase [Bacteroidales bacterium]
MQSPLVHFVVVAAGEGQRFSSTIPKQFVKIHGKTLAYHTLNALYKAFPEAIFTLVINPEHQSYWNNVFQELSFSLHHIIEGGRERFHSVKNGLTYIKNDQIVAIHDIARPIVSPLLIQKGVELAIQHGTAIPILPLNDALIHIDSQGIYYADRRKFFRVQTPQFFRANIILHAYQQESQIIFPDDASVALAAGYELHFFDGDLHNIKLTHPEDLSYVKTFLS